MLAIVGLVGTGLLFASIAAITILPRHLPALLHPLHANLDRAALAVVLALACLPAASAVRDWLWPSVHWRTFSPSALAASRARGDIVVIGFRSEWSLSTNILWSMLDRSDVVGALNGAGIAPFMVDLTSGTPEEEALLASFGRNTIPLLVVLDRSGDVSFIRDSFTPDSVVDAIHAAGVSR